LKKYEALFILANTIPDEQLEAKIEKIGSEIARLGGTVKATTRMGRIPFARPLAKKEAGIYVQIVLMMEPAKIKSLPEYYRHNEDVVRLQITTAKSSAGEKTPETTRLRPNGYGGQAGKAKPTLDPSAENFGNAAKQATT
jgi:ribosomal protein S6